MTMEPKLFSQAEPPWIAHDVSAVCPVPERAVSKALRVLGWGSDESRNPVVLNVARYIAAHEPLGDVPPELVREIYDQLGPKFQHLAPLVAAEYLKNEPAPVDPLREIVEAVLSEHFTLSEPDLRDITEAFRARLPAAVAAIEGEG